MEPVIEKSSVGDLDANVAAGLSQIFGWVSALIFFFVETKSKFVKFYAMQMLLFSALWLVLCILNGVLNVLSFTLPYMLGGAIQMLLGLAISLLGLASFALWIVLLIFAFQGKTLKLPIIGQIAEDLAIKSLNSNNPNP